jgi:hypothetical protein
VEGLINASSFVPNVPGDTISVNTIDPVMKNNAIGNKRRLWLLSGRNKKDVTSSSVPSPGVSGSLVCAIVGRTQRFHGSGRAGRRPIVGRKEGVHGSGRAGNRPVVGRKEGVYGSGGAGSRKCGFKKSFYRCRLSRRDWKCFLTKVVVGLCSW